MRVPVGALAAALLVLAFATSGRLGGDHNAHRAAAVRILAPAISG